MPDPWQLAQRRKSEHQLNISQREGRGYFPKGGSWVRIPSSAHGGGGERGKGPEPPQKPPRSRQRARREGGRDRRAPRAEGRGPRAPRAERHSAATAGPGAPPETGRRGGGREGDSRTKAASESNGLVPFQYLSAPLFEIHLPVLCSLYLRISLHRFGGTHSRPWLADTASRMNGSDPHCFSNSTKISSRVMDFPSNLSLMPSGRR